MWVFSQERMFGVYDEIGKHISWNIFEEATPTGRQLLR